MIEAATSKQTPPWPIFSFTFKAQLEDELREEVYYLSVGINKDAAVFSSEIPFVASKMDLETAVMSACLRTALYGSVCVTA